MSPRRAATAGWLVVLLAACGAPGGSSQPLASPLLATNGPSRPAPSPAAPTPSSAASQSVTPANPTAAAWTRLEADGKAPAAREDHTWTLDPGTGVAYLFGGRSGATSFDDLWTFDLATDTWTELPVTGEAPAGRFGHEAAWAPGRGLVVTLGQAGTGFFDDVWLLDPKTRSWRKLPGSGERPVARYGSCSGIGPDGRLWISHGFTEEGTRFFDTRAYDFEAETWTDETPADLQPVERCLHTCWWIDGGDFILYGGQTTGVPALGDLWALEHAGSGRPGTWAKLPTPELPARHLPATARRGDVTVIVGGRDIDRKPLGDAWLLADGETTVALRVAGIAPSPRSGASLIYDPARDRMLLLGGIGESAMDDLWELSFD